MAAKTKENYEHHYMSPKGGGKGRMTKSLADHKKLQKAGWTHSKSNPLKKKVVNSYMKKKGY